MSQRDTQYVWPPWEVTHSREQLCNLRDVVRRIDSRDDDTAAHMGRFLVVRACGHIEFTLETTALAIVQRRAAPEVHKYVAAGLFKGRNPKPSRLVDFLSSFNEGWGAAVEKLLADEDALLKRELEFMVDRRNKIAHGQSEGIGRVKALQLSDYALSISDCIIDTLNPLGSGAPPGS